ncbi:MAG: TorF family putative porin [Methylophilus sp.]|nr:TorF family putative porin [Methylophilus sp.]MDP3609620.1 TorF family putative porin [Methylophilus sp.]
MRKSILLTAVLGTLAMTNIAYAEEAVVEAAPAAAPAEPESAWTATSNIGFVSDYYTRGISQSWHKPAVQGGFDIAHSSGFFAGVWGSNVSPNTFPDATVELDLYGGYTGSITDDIGYTVGVIGYFYPGGSWKKYDGLTTDQGKKSGGRWDTYEANVAVSYKWLSAKVSVTLGDWFGAEKATGWDGGTSGSTYVELNAAYPLPFWDLTLIGHVGHLNVSGKLESTGFPTANGTPGTYETSPDYTDYKIGLSKSFKVAGTEGWNAGLYYVGADDNGYWDNGYGGTSFSRSINGTTETKDLADGRLVVSVGRTF